jgi:D-alanyl-lipoteichoic acid acyltransferase DltB (MBOAT superfamily)
MTLSRFLRDYLYIPLGGNRKGPARRYANLIVTMLLGGLWHGAGWNFVIWGGLHGVGLTLNHLWRGRGLVLPAAAAQLLTLVFVMFAWVPFRAETLDATLAVWAGMAGLNGLGHSAPNLRGFLLILGSLAVALFAPNTQQLLSYPADLRQPLSWQPKIGWAITAGALFGAAGSFIITQQPSEFLYFRF